MIVGPTGTDISSRRQYVNDHVGDTWDEMIRGAYWDAEANGFVRHRFVVKNQPTRPMVLTLTKRGRELLGEMNAPTDGITVDDRHDLTEVLRWDLR